MTRNCGHHDDYDDDDDKRHTLIRRIIYTIIATISVILITIFLIWIILHPTKPEFIIQDATLYSFNLTQPNHLTTSFQVTISTRNPNDKIGIFYERATVYASYRNQQITPSTSIPYTYQGHNDIVLWSPFLNGQNEPIDMNLGMQLLQDQCVGYAKIDVKISGIVKWKVGSWISNKYHLNVNCPAYVSFGQNSSKGSLNGNGNNDGVIMFKYSVNDHILSICEVDV